MKILIKLANHPYTGQTITLMNSRSRGNQSDRVICQVFESRITGGIVVRLDSFAGPFREPTCTELMSVRDNENLLAWAKKDVVLNIAGAIVSSRIDYKMKPPYPHTYEGVQNLLGGSTWCRVPSTIPEIGGLDCSVPTTQEIINKARALSLTFADYKDFKAAYEAHRGSNPAAWDTVEA